MRGEITNRARATQIRDFRGLRFGNITPTDIDALLDFGDKLFILIESKYKDTKLPYGQRLALERLCDALQNAGKMAVVLVVSHNAEPHQDIDFASTIVVEYRYNKTWIHPQKETTCKQAIEIFLNMSGINYKEQGNNR